eukprot:4364-Pelagococcus_subviridis.AAC.1
MELGTVASRWREVCYANATRRAREEGRGEEAGEARGGTRTRAVESCWRRYLNTIEIDSNARDASSSIPFERRLVRRSRARARYTTTTNSRSVAFLCARGARDGSEEGWRASGTISYFYFELERRRSFVFLVVRDLSEATPRARLSRRRDRSRESGGD